MSLRGSLHPIVWGEETFGQDIREGRGEKQQEREDEPRRSHSMREKKGVGACGVCFLPGPGSLESRGGGGEGAGVRRGSLRAPVSTENVAERGVVGGPGEGGRVLGRGADSHCLTLSAITLQFCFRHHSPCSPCAHRPQSGRLHLPGGPRAQVQARHPARPAPQRGGPGLEAHPAPAHQDQLRGLLLPVQRCVGRGGGGHVARALLFRAAAALLRITGRQVDGTGVVHRGRIPHQNERLPL